MNCQSAYLIWGGSLETYKNEARLRWEKSRKFKPLPIDGRMWTGRNPHKNLFH